MVRGEHATTFIPELEMEIPPNNKGHMTTLEGFLVSFKEDLELGQEYRREQNPAVADQIDDFLTRLDKYLAADPEVLPYTFILDDPSGNSFVQNFLAPNPDPNLKAQKYTRSIEQIRTMGYEPENIENYVKTKSNEEESQEAKKKFEELKKKKLGASANMEGAKVNYTAEQTDDLIKKALNTKKIMSAHKVDFTKPLEENALNEELVEFEVPCNACNQIGYMRMCTCSIPYFKELIIMAFTCELCGHRSTEVKTGGEISKQGRKVTIYVKEEKDLNRDLFKSESAEIEIPEVGCTVVAGSLGGVYSTVEGLLEKMLEVLEGDNPFVGDSADVGQKSNFQKFIDSLKELKEGKKYPFRVILDDPLANCFIQNPEFPKPDRGIEILDYDRTDEQNEELGIKYLMEAEKERLKLEEQEKRKIVEVDEEDNDE